MHCKKTAKIFLLFLLVAAMEARRWGEVEQIQSSPFPVLRLFLKANGDFPNNDDQPLIIYRGAIEKSQCSDGRALLISNG